LNEARVGDFAPDADSFGREAKYRIVLMDSIYEIGLATSDDIFAIVEIQDRNLHENGGGLSVRQAPEWFKRTMSEMPIVVARRGGKVVGYALATSVAAKSHVGIVQAMLRSFPAPANCYLYGPVCVAETERGNGLAAMMYKEMRATLPGRTAMSFVRQDNISSLKANRRMGKTELGEFIHDSDSYIVFAFTS
jgi:L-amino acid N-acyltransferase YncA